MGGRWRMGGAGVSSYEVSLDIGNGMRRWSLDAAKYWR